ncbi:nitroreductase family protein [Candidatus Micrarchaeota archaeon]|nr:nitroreductase family protein [Candidatus Micrarchaeota archaeon]
MEFFEVLKNRHSARKFKDTAVEDDKLMKILEAANSAPSAGDLQAYEIVVVRDKERRERLADAAHGQESVRSAPLVLVFFTHPEKSSKKYGERGAELYCLQDATIAAAYAQLAATALGLGCVWVGGFDEEEVVKVTGAKKNLRPVVIFPIGYAAESPRATTRRNIDELAHDETL